MQIIQQYNIHGISDFTWGLDVNAGGFSTLRASGGVVWNLIKGGYVAADRGWTEEDGKDVGNWREHGGRNQRFKLEPLPENTQQAPNSPCNELST